MKKQNKQNKQNEVQTPAPVAQAPAQAPLEVAIVPTPAPAAEEKKGETKLDARPLASVVALFNDADSFHPTLRDGESLTASEWADFIADREAKRALFGSQSRFAFYDAGLTEKGEEVRKAIETKLLAGGMTKPAFYNLKSEALSLVPLALNEPRFANLPLTTIKNMVAAFKVGDTLALTDKGAIDDTRVTEAGKKLLATLQAGESLSQGKVNEIRREFTTDKGGTTKPTATQPATQPTAAKSAEDEKKEADAKVALAYAAFRKALNDASTYLGTQAANLGAEERKHAEDSLHNIARFLGFTVVRAEK